MVIQVSALDSGAGFLGSGFRVVGLGVEHAMVVIQQCVHCLSLPLTQAGLGHRQNFEFGTRDRQAQECLKQRNPKLVTQAGMDFGG